MTEQLIDQTIVWLNDDWLYLLAVLGWIIVLGSALTYLFSWYRWRAYNRYLRKQRP